MEKLDIKSLTLEELTEAIRQMGDKPFRKNRFTSGFIRNW